MPKENKFTKSVLERLTEEQSTPKPQPKPESAKKAKPVEQKPVKEAPAPVKEKPVKAAKAEPVIPDISQFIIKTEQRSAKNKTFYLDTQVIDGIKAVAEDQGTTDSRLVNDILRQVLGLDS